jgi:putative peptidoglycan lipid II flippase
VIAGLVFQSGAFTALDARWVWVTLGGATLGLLPQSLGRLLTSAHFALGDTRTPLRYATFRVMVGPAIGLVAAVWGPGLLGIDARWGTAGLTIGTAAAGTLEYALLRRSLTRRVGGWTMPAGAWPRLWGAALVGVVVGRGAAMLANGAPVAVAGVTGVAAFGVVYLGLMTLLKSPEAITIWTRLRRR